MARAGAAVAADGARPAERQASWLRLFLGKPRSRHDHLDALDGLRGLAVLIVIASHLSNARLLPWPGVAGWGKGGVYLFFVLSAFLLTRALLRRPLAGFASGRLWADYALRRVLRIWPLYLVVLLASWGLTRAGVEWFYRMDAASLAGHLLLREGQRVLWSIPVEFKFYLWLPLLAFALAGLQALRWPAWAGLAILAALLALVSWIWPPGEAVLNGVGLGPYLPVFLCGAFAALLDLRLRERPRPGRWAVAGWGGAAVLALLGSLLAIPAVWAWLTRTDFNHMLSQHWFVWFGLVWAVLLLAVLHGPGLLRAPFAAAPLRLVGVVSFSAYLWHMPVLEVLRAAGVGRWPWAAPGVVLAAMMAVSMLSFLLLERPWREVRFPGATAVRRDASSG